MAVLPSEGEQSFRKAVLSVLIALAPLGIPGNQSQGHPNPSLSRAFRRGREWPEVTNLLGLTRLERVLELVEEYFLRMDL